jgi:TPR repeat protein
MTEWLAEAAKTNRFLQKLRLVEAKRDAAQAAAWMSEVEDVADDAEEEGTKEVTMMACEALVLALAHGTPLIPKNTKRALVEACVARGGDPAVDVGRRVVGLDKAAATEAAFGLAKTHPHLLVALGSFFARADPLKAGKLLSMAMERPELRVEALVEYGSLLDERKPPDHARAFRAYREACDIVEKDDGHELEWTGRLVLRMCEMYEKGEGTEKNLQEAFKFATIAGAS